MTCRNVGLCTERLANNARSESIMAQSAPDPMTASHAYVIVAATLTAAIATNRPATFNGANAVYDAYVKIYQKVRLEEVNPVSLRPERWWFKLPARAGLRHAARFALPAA
jgi:hypothetical protein